MKNEFVVPEDLDVLLRREELSKEQWQAFERRLKEEPLSELAYRAGVAFDRITDVREGDEERIRRCAERAMQARRIARGPRRKGLALWLSAALVLVTTSGLAWWSQSGMPRRRAPVSGFSRTMKPRFDQLRESVTSRATRPVPPISAPTTRPEAPPDPPVFLTDVPHERATSPAAGTSLLRPTASELLSRANTARGKGWFTEASELYRQLQREYPGSAEARLSSISLGRIGLTRGQAGTALLEFEEYLQSGGPLAEEALVGKAHALFALGRTDAQRATYRELLQRFPGSVYATEARTHLGVDSEEP